MTTVYKTQENYIILFPQNSPVMGYTEPIFYLFYWLNAEPNGSTDKPYCTESLTM